MIELPDPQATEALGRLTALALREGDVIALFGDLGSGKTTFTRGLLLGLGHEGDVASPTFPIVQTYDPPDVKLPVWHVDLYRIEDPAEIEELALDEARIDGVLIIEWPERLVSLWPDALQLHFRFQVTGGRTLTAIVPPAWERRWPPR